MTDPQVRFEETTEIERGFAEVFAREIAPELDVLEAKRQKLDAEGNRRLVKGLAWGGGLALLILLFSLHFMAVAVGFLVAFGGLVIGLVGRQDAARDWGAHVTELVMPAVCRHIGDLTYAKDGTGFDPSDFRQLKLFGDYDTAKLAHDIAGQHLGVGFRMVHASLRRTWRDSDGKEKSKTVFSGLLMRIAVPVSAPTRILILKDRGAVGNALTTLFRSASTATTRIDTGHARFEEAFELHAGKYFDVDGFLPPRFLDTLVDLGEEGGRSAKSMTAAFDGATFYLALSGWPPFLQFHGLGRPVYKIADDLHDVFDDLTTAHRIVDRLAGG